MNENELREALAQAQAVGDKRVADFCSQRLSALAPSTGKLPNMDAYLAKCIARCRPKAK